MRTIRLVLAGLGHVGSNFLQLMHTQRAVLREVHGLEFVLVGAADSRHVIAHPDGLDPLEVQKAKRRPEGLSTFVARRQATPLLEVSALVEQTDADILLEATPVNLQHGQPGLDLVRSALRRGVHAVLANKGPLALAYSELAAAAHFPWGKAPWDKDALEGAHPQDPTAKQSKLRFSACVGGALPTINIGLRDLAGTRITKVEAAVNGTCQGIVRMMERDISFGDALAEMQRRGVVEKDPALDIDGWDEAVKLVIIANAVLRQPTTLADVTVEGIRALTPQHLQNVLGWEERITLVGSAEWNGERYDLSVQPTALPIDHPISRMDDDEMGVVYHTDVSGRISAFSAETSAVPTAAAMVRDVIDIAAGG